MILPLAERSSIGVNAYAYEWWLGALNIGPHTEVAEKEEEELLSSYMKMRV